ncbi:MAG: helix-turn-helix transcriptional regulator [Coriobacteriia bacterium]|nr:helix-turn-helix transcriptional regulator [Coriobacteriia bacterium]
MGFAGLTAWSTVLFASMVLLPQPPAGDTLSPIQLASTIATMTSSLLLALTAGRITSLERHPELVYLGGIVGAAGTCCVALSGSGYLGAGWIPVGYALVGLGTGTVTGAWWERLVRLPILDAALTLVVCAFVGYAAGVCVSALPFAITVPCASLLPIASAFLTIIHPQVTEVAHAVTGAVEADAHSAKENAAAWNVRDTAEVTYLPTPATPLSLAHCLHHAPWRLFAVVLLVGTAYGLIRATGVTGGIVTTTTIPALLSQVSLDMAAILTAAMIALGMRRASTAAALYPMFVAIAAGALLLTGDNPTLQSVAAALGHLGSFIVTMLALFLIMAHVRAGRIAPLFGVGLLKTCEMLGMALGQTSVALFVERSVLVATVLALLLAAALVVMGDPAGFSVELVTTPGIDGNVVETAAVPPQPENNAGSDRVAGIARRFGLSARETEILQLWGAGHTGSFIEQELGISKNTVKTHLSHIYAKTGVANKNELLRLVEGEGEREH